ncbi:MAG: polyprenyl synthetase family protein [Deltaproteobacteria bacterium]|nr:polyprenyl synthetase family protein [Deltaproteobacteria bacterium]
MNSPKEDLKVYLNSRKELVDQALNRRLSSSGSPHSATVFESMRYSLFAGGKRLRPILCLAAVDALGGDRESVMDAACALEMIHTYSLIHDDLPAMDDDDFRRGRPTNHKIFGEGIAILAGDALLTEAFDLLAGSPLKGQLTAQRLLRVIQEIAAAAGVNGMVGGQAADLESEGKPVDRQVLQYIHNHKTEKMITVSLRSGAIAAGADDGSLVAITEYGRRIGLAFQIADDILDIVGDQEALGKDVGSDEAKKKATYPALYGIDASRREANRLVEESLKTLERFDHRADPLRMLARFIVERTY